MLLFSFVYLPPLYFFQDVSSCGFLPMRYSVAANYALSTFNCPLSTYNCPLSTFNCPLSTIYCPLSTINCPLSTINYPLSTINYPLPGCSRTNSPSQLSPKTPAFWFGSEPDISRAPGVECPGIHQRRMDSFLSVQVLPKN